MSASFLSKSAEQCPILSNCRKRNGLANVLKSKERILLHPNGKLKIHDYTLCVLYNLLQKSFLHCLHRILLELCSVELCIINFTFGIFTHFRFYYGLRIGFQLLLSNVWIFF